MFRRLAAFALASASLSTLAIARPQDAAPPVESVAAPEAPLTDQQAAMKAHVMFLASDAMRGREAGSPEYDIAAQYVAAQFFAAGLKPAGDAGGYLQHVPLVSYTSADHGAMTLTGADGQAVVLEYGKDYIPGVDPEAAERKVSAPIVFVGQGIVAPDYDRDDYAGVDVTGKIVAMIASTPQHFDGEQRAHFGSPTGRITTAGEHGAVGVIVIQGSKPSRFSFERMADFADREQVTWRHPDGTGKGAAPNTPGLGVLSKDASAKLLAGVDPAMIAAAESEEGGFRAVELKARLSAEIHTGMRPIESANVAGLLPGSDPTLGSEVVVLSAHLDHVGVGEPDATGDTIYNGAMDNAVGIASLIEEAKRFKASGTPPRRSILFLAVTAEEKGLIGSDYFANNPTLPKEKLVADVNLDMPIITYKFDDVIAFGAARSSLGPIVEQAAKDAGATFSPDPMPEQGLFVRSDHYRFVQQGIPSVFLWPGEAGAGKAAVEKFFAEHYHQASDQVDNPDINWESGVRFINVNYQIARGIADAPERPSWNKGDFFGTLYNGYGAK